jgi:AraC family ethanolamine operon transcriptional activator
MQDESEVASGYCIRQSFPLFEQLARAARGWDLDFCQLSATSMPFQMDLLDTSRMQYGRVAFGSHFRQSGGTSLEFRTFAMHATAGSDYRWCGEWVDSSKLVVFPADGHFESISKPGFDVFTFSLSTELLERTAEVQFQRPLSSFMDSSGLICHLAIAPLQKLRAMLAGISEDVGYFASTGVPTYTRTMAASIEQGLACQVLLCLDHGQALVPRGARGKRMQILKRSIDLIEQLPVPEVSIPELTERVGVSRRTLEHAFQDGLDMSPAAYLKAMRLKALNKQLLICERGDTSVATLCKEQGFRHLGQAAADYRAMFGELPSATLRRPT